MVAKSYQDLQQVGEVFIANGKQYVNVKLKSGKLKTVRFYTDKEYAKLYPTAQEPAETRSADPYYKPQKIVLGFEHGYITIFKGDTYAKIDWFHSSGARYTRWWGWYFLSTQEVPTDLPEGLTPIRLPWELVGGENGKLKTEAEVIAAVDTLLYEPSGSEYVGSIGERLELFLTVDQVINLENAYGHSSLYIMHDDIGNIFTWTTQAKQWEVNSEHHIRGTVKDHKLWKNDRQTILTRCTEVK